MNQRHLLMGLFLALGSTEAFAQIRDPFPPSNQPMPPRLECRDFRRKPSEIPFPFTNRSLKLELAHKEYYWLRGQVREIAGVPFFEIDYQEAPVLFNENRKNNPAYRIDGDARAYDSFVGNRVQFIFQSKFQIEPKTGDVEIVLKPVLLPGREYQSMQIGPRE
jgi:hypothetical protein